MTIYFIEAASEGPIKIGYTAGAATKRMAQLQTGQPIKLRLMGTIPGTDAEERSIHRELSSYRTNGEWFRPAKELVRMAMHLIDGQLPWFHCRVIRYFSFEREWEEAFSIGSADKSAYEEVSVNETVGNMYAHLLSPPVTQEVKDERIPKWALERIKEETEKRLQFAKRVAELDPSFRLSSQYPSKKDRRAAQHNLRLAARAAHESRVQTGFSAPPSSARVR